MDSPEQTNQYHTKAIDLMEDSNFQEAAIFFNKAIEDPECPTELVIDSIINNCRLYANQGDLLKGQDYLDLLQNYPLSNRAKGERFLCQYNMASKKGEYDKASKIIIEGVEHCKKYEEECRALLGMCYIKQAGLSAKSKAQDLFFKAYEILKDLGNPNQQIYCMAMLGISFNKDLKKAEEWYDKAWALASSNVQKYEVWLGRISTWRAYSYMQFSEYDKAIDSALNMERMFMKEGNALSLSERPFNYNYLCQSYCMKGDYFEGLLYGQKALLLSKKLNIKRAITYSAENITLAYNHIGNHQLSLKYALLAFETFKAADKNWASTKHFTYLHGTYHSLGKAYKNSDKEKANFYFQEALKVLDKTEIDDSLMEYIEIYSCLSDLHLNEKGIEYAQKALSSNSPIRDQVYLPMGNAYLALDKPSEAINAFTKFLNFCHQKQEGFNIQDSESILQFKSLTTGMQGLSKMGQAYFQLYKKNQDKEDLKTAIRYFEASFDLLSLLKNGIDLKSQIVVNNNLANDYAWYLKALQAQENTDFDKVIEIFEACKGSVLHQSLVAKETQKKFEHLPLVQQEKDLQKNLQKIEQSLEQAEEGEEKNKQYEVFFEQRKAYQDFLVYLKEKHPEYFEAKNNIETFNLKDLQEKLKEDQKVVSYLLSENDIFILYLDQFEVSLRRIDKPIDFDENVKAYFKAIKFYDQSVYLEKAPLLYQLLLAPIEDLLVDIFGNESIMDLLIIPHGLISKIPFEALFNKQIENSPNYLLNSFDVSYHYSLNLFVKKELQAEQPEQLSDFLGFAPVYESLSKEKVSSFLNNMRNYDGFTWNPLPYSKKEVEKIKELFEQRKDSSALYLNQEANKKHLIENLNDFKFIHLAAHFHQHEIPQRSGLVLSDEYLYVNEAYALDTQAELIVLSACESGLGELSQSEGVMSISRALLYAGAQNIISTLYEVNDLSASDLMELFYSELLEGQSIKKSLNNAKRKYIQTKQEMVKNWAAFTLIGE